MIKAIIRSGLLIAALIGIAPFVYAQLSDASVILQFQRAADSYAFAQGQDERRNTPTRQLSEGEFFTPTVAAAFRTRIRGAVKVAGCGTPAQGEGGSEVPPVNASAASTEPVPQCVSAALPHLPAALEYRVAGIALVLADARRNVVVDVLHAAFP